MPTTTRPTDEFITAATLRALASGVFEPGRLERGMWLALDPRSCILPNGAIDIPSESMGFVIFYPSKIKCGFGAAGLSACGCADNALWCKHRIAAALLIRALDAQNAATAAQDKQPTQAPTPEPERPTVPALAPVIPPSEPAPTKRRKVKSPKSTPASVEVPPGGIREFKSTMTPEERARAMKALWG